MPSTVCTDNIDELASKALAKSGVWTNDKEELEDRARFLLWERRGKPAGGAVNYVALELRRFMGKESKKGVTVSLTSHSNDDSGIDSYDPPSHDSYDEQAVQQSWEERLEEIRATLEDEEVGDFDRFVWWAYRVEGLGAGDVASRYRVNPHEVYGAVQRVDGMLRGRLER